MKLNHFKRSEFNCPCCKKESMDDDFLLRVDQARTEADVPFRITSGFRCENYQLDLKKRGYETANGVSPHMKGVACDISVSNDSRRWDIIDALIGVGFNRIGIGSNFVHADIDLDRNSNRIWYYKR